MCTGLRRIQRVLFAETIILRSLYGLSIFCRTTRLKGSILSRAFTLINTTSGRLLPRESNIIVQIIIMTIIHNMSLITTSAPVIGRTVPASLLNRMIVGMECSGFTAAAIEKNVELRRVVEYHLKIPQQVRN